MPSKLHHLQSTIEAVGNRRVVRAPVGFGRLIFVAAVAVFSRAACAAAFTQEQTAQGIFNEYVSPYSLELLLSDRRNSRLAKLSKDSNRLHLRLRGRPDRQPHSASTLKPLGVQKLPAERKNGNSGSREIHRS